MPSKLISLGIVGVGKIVRDQHLPSIENTGYFSLDATASRNASVDGVAAYQDISSMLEATKLDAVALCMPPQYRYDAAKLALQHGKHVLLEKPPGATVSEVEQLQDIAAQNGVSLYATWHSRHGAAVESAKAMLANRELKSAKVCWKEDVRKWHPGQEWIWQAGGLGVFDPGINGLSILTHCLKSPAYVSSAMLTFPSNKAAPIAAEISFKTTDGADIEGVFDWRFSEGEAWSIEFYTDQGVLKIIDGGAKLSLNDELVDVPAQSETGEYESIYSHFAELIHGDSSDVDLSPLKLVADAFLLADREYADAFFE